MLSFGKPKPQYRNFRRDVDNDFGFQYEQFQSTMAQFAMKNPSDYHVLRDVVKGNLRDLIVKHTYLILYDVLTSGDIEINGRTQSVADINSAGFTKGAKYGIGAPAIVRMFKPNMNEEEVDEKAKGAAMQIQKIVCEIIDDILPLASKYENIPMNNKDSATASSAPSGSIPASRALDPFDSIV